MSRQSPLLSIGIIFKNEIRCLERCLKSLEPLRQAVPCEVVMADTGSDDGSRAVAEHYADILINFPWIDDFAAARNAVMDRCSGKWYMTIDCDEWLGPDIHGYVDFLSGEYDFDFGSVIVRNYDTVELDKGGPYSDFLAARLLRMSTGIRYEGAIHEHWPYKDDLRTLLISGAIFHHDGYVYQNTAMIKAKQERNMMLLRKQLEEKPDDLIILTQCAESCEDIAEQESYLRRALVGVSEKWSQWELFGGPIYRHAVHMALRGHLPELEEWIGQAEAMFPDSIFVRVEIAYFAFGHYWNTDDYEKALHWGERYLQGVEDYHAGRFNRADLLASSLDKTDNHSRLSVAVVMVEGYLHENQPENSARLLEQLDPCEMDVNQVVVCVHNLCRLHSEFGRDTDAQMLRFWERIGELVPTQEKAKERQTVFIQAGSAMFLQEYRETEANGSQFYDYAYTAFLPLENICPLGIAAAILEASTIHALTEKLRKVERWLELPIQALQYALERGVPFPLPDKPLDMEMMAGLATRLAQDRKNFLPLALRLTEHIGEREWPELVWVQTLLAAAVRTYPWSSKDQQDETEGMALAQAFARVEQTFLPLYYAENMLCEDRLLALPALHRLGWYCIRAFDSLKSNGPVEYVRWLRAGLDVCEEAKDIVEFLVDHTREVQQTMVPPELKALADKVRLILSRFEPNDPAVIALKQSEAYQQVAYLLEK